MPFVNVVELQQEAWEYQEEVLESQEPQEAWESQEPLEVWESLEPQEALASQEIQEVWESQEPQVQQALDVVMNILGQIWMTI